LKLFILSQQIKSDSCWTTCVYLNIIDPGIPQSDRTVKEIRSITPNQSLSHLVENPGIEERTRVLDELIQVSKYSNLKKKAISAQPDHDYMVKTRTTI
jgi:hypothetical protein